MRRPIPLAIAVLMGGCLGPAPPPLPDSLLAPTDLLADPQDPALEPRYDLRGVGLRELNGSLVFTLTLENMTEGVPQFVVRVLLQIDGVDHEYFLRNEHDPNRPPSYLNWRWGVVNPAGHLENRGRICAVASQNRPPWTIEAELLHADSGLLGGGFLRRVHAETSTFGNESQDSASVDRVLGIRGGANPHPGCPLLAERPRQAP